MAPGDGRRQKTRDNRHRQKTPTKSRRPNFSGVEQDTHVLDCNTSFNTTYMSIVTRTIYVELKESLFNRITTKGSSQIRGSCGLPCT
ncbi:MAG: hypothetical protein [Cressdnaviricota sp.]|nr:MAG: hypothetical protein [Cressdnaviricota sp.]